MSVSGGGLAYFLAVEITLLDRAGHQLLFAQRNAFKSNLRKAAFWYAVAYVVITIAAAALPSQRPDLRAWGDFG